MGNSEFQIAEDVVSRFWKHVDVSGSSDCWEWTGARSGSGYGHMRVGKNNVSAHRISWAIVNGDIPKKEGYHGGCICHNCDNRGCVNPTHLFLGSNVDNMRDMAKKGRAAKNTTQCAGELSYSAKLKMDDVLYIRSHAEVSALAAAKMFGVSRSIIYRIRNGEKWKILL